MKTILIALLLSACSSATKPENKLLVWEEWKGLPVTALADHPYFKTMSPTKVKHENGIETWSYLDQTKYHSDAYCQSMGGCLGMPIYNCDNIFSIKENVILGYKQQGSCRELKAIEAPKTPKV